MFRSNMKKMYKKNNNLNSPFHSMAFIKMYNNIHAQRKSGKNILNFRLYVKITYTRVILTLDGVFARKTK